MIFGELPDPGEHVGGEDILIILTDGFVSPQIVAYLVPAELDAGAGDHSDKK